MIPINQNGHRTQLSSLPGCATASHLYALLPFSHFFIGYLSVSKGASRGKTGTLTRSESDSFFGIFFFFFSSWAFGTVRPGGGLVVAKHARVPELDVRVLLLQLLLLVPYPAPALLKVAMMYDLDTLPLQRDGFFFPLPLTYRFVSFDPVLSYSSSSGANYQCRGPVMFSFLTCYRMRRDFGRTRLVG